MNVSIEPTPYQELGGDEPLRRVVDRFYDLMLCEPDVAEVRDMHGSDTTQIRERLFDFLSGWLGGPSRFIEKHGHPRLRFRHRFFRIGVLERDQWMFCMRKALAETPMDVACASGSSRRWRTWPMPCATIRMIRTAAVPAVAQARRSTPGSAEADQPG
ncbi:Group 2 truncated hemoglobin GlbO [Stutzerimonas frequens]|nr:Group 2 truncated hemoglobin GlbO [Stutzerimonas frequens]